MQACLVLLIPQLLRIQEDLTTSLAAEVEAAGGLVIRAALQIVLAGRAGVLLV